MRVGELRVTPGERLFDSTNHTSSLDALLGHRDQALRAARSVGPGIMDLVVGQSPRSPGSLIFGQGHPRNDSSQGKSGSA